MSTEVVVYLITAFFVFVKAMDFFETENIFVALFKSLLVAAIGPLVLLGGISIVSIIIGILLIIAGFIILDRLGNLWSM
jgi:hypothetical protein